MGIEESYCCPERSHRGKEMSIVGTPESEKAVLMKEYGEKFDLYMGTDKEDVVHKAEMMLLEGRYVDARIELSKLKTSAQLFNQLGEVLKGKSVADTVRKVLAGKATKYETLKGLFSLGTHICIELEKGQDEYQPLLRLIHRSIWKAIDERK